MKNKKRINNKFQIFASWRLAGSCAASCVINLGVICAILFVSCFAPLDYNNGTTLSIRFTDNGPSRATVWTDRNDLMSMGVLVHHITLRGPSGTQTRRLEYGVKATSFDVVPGSYTIHVETTLFGEIYAQQTTTVDVILGQNTPVAIVLEQVVLDSYYSPASFFSVDSNGVLIGDPVASGDIIIPATVGGRLVTAIGSSAFSNYTGITSIIIPNSVTSIGSGAFYDCINLSNVILGDRVEDIWHGAFDNNRSLSSVFIPSSVIIIGESVFRDCRNLISIDVCPDNTVYSSLDGILYDKNRSTLVQYPGGKIAGTVIIRDEVINIYNHAFENRTDLTDIIFPNNLISIGDWAFSGCLNLGNVTIPDNVETIGMLAFQNCSGFTNLTIPDSVTSIGQGAFTQNRNITNLRIGKNVKSIGGSAFQDLSNITNIIIPESVTSIGRDAFFRCYSLNRITFEGSIPAAGFDINAFDGNLRDVYYAQPESDRIGTYVTLNPGEFAVWTKE